MIAAFSYSYNLSNYFIFKLKHVERFSCKRFTLVSYFSFFSILFLFTVIIIITMAIILQLTKDRKELF